MGEAVVPLARLGRAIGAVHAAPGRLGDAVFRRPVQRHPAAAVVGCVVVRRHQAAMQEAEMRVVDIAFQRLQPVALPLDAEEAELLGGQSCRLELGQRRRHRAGTEIGPDEAGALHHREGASLDLVLEVLVRQHVRHVNAVAGDVELPAVVDAADAARLVAAEEQRGAAMRAAMVHHADLARAVAEGDQLLAEQHQAERRAVRGQFRRHAGRDPVLPHQLAHRRAGAGMDQDLAVALGRHGRSLLMGRPSPGRCHNP